MKRQKFLALTLAFTMTFSTLFTVHAEDEAIDVAEDSVAEEVLDDSTDSDEMISDDLLDDGAENSGDEADADETEADNDEADSSVDADSETETGSSDEDASEDTTSEENTEITTEASEEAEGDIDLATIVSSWKAIKIGNNGNAFEDKGNGTVATIDINNKYDKNKGKMSENDAQFAYWTPTDGVDIDYNFVFSATMTIEEMAMQGGTNQGQLSAGLMVAGDVNYDYNQFYGNGKANDGAPPAVFSYVHFDDKAGNAGSAQIKANARRYWNEEEELYQKISVSDFKTTPNILSDTFTKLETGGSYKLQISKLGNSYVVSCGDKKVQIDYDPRNFTGPDGDHTLIYPGLFAARDIRVSFTDIKLDVKDTKMTNVEVVQQATNNEVFVGHTPELPGLKLRVTYEDGSTQDVEEGYQITNYDPNKVGPQTIQIKVGERSANYNITVKPKEVTDLRIISTPMKVDYFEGQYLRSENLVVEADFSDGEKDVTLERDDYDFFIDGKLIGEGNFITSDMAGKKNVVIKHKQTDAVFGDASASFPITISPLKLTGIQVTAKPSKQTYYVGDVQDTRGMVVAGIYTDESGSKQKYDVLYSLVQTIDDKNDPDYQYKYRYLENTEFEVSDQKTFDTSKTGTKTITVSSKFNPSLTADIEVRVINKVLLTTEITSYPRTTYPILKDVSDSDYDPQYWYDYYNGTGTAENETKQYNMGNLEITYTYTSGDKEVAPPQDYEVILDNFDIRKTEGSYIRVEFPKGTPGYGNEAVDIPITVMEEEYPENHWKPVIFGASTKASASNLDTDTMGIIFYDKNGKATPFDTRPDSGKSYTDENIEDEGTSLRIWASNGAGKQADSNDGISYYYTRLNTKDHFKLSADIVVHSYVNGNEDTARDGQEGFGIMARDIVPLMPVEGQRWDKDDPTKQAANLSKARFFYNMYDDDGNLQVVTDKNGEPEPLSNTVYNYSNMVLLGGHSGSGWPADEKADNYVFNSTKNRINLIYRTFITGDPYSASSDVMRSSVNKTLSEDFPGPGSDGTEKKYHISLEKINGGYKGICYDYQSKEFRTDYVYYDDEEDEDDLDILDPDNLYVGFFATRYADITVSNVELLKSDPSTDIVSHNSETVTKATTPRVSLDSSSYTSNKKYNLVLKTNNYSGGTVSIQQDGKLIYKDYPIGRRGTSFPVILKEDTTNKFTVLFTPGYMDENEDNYQVLTSYDSKNYEFIISHKSNFDIERKFIYVSADEDNAAGSGSITDPMDFDTALGMMTVGQKLILLPGTYKRTEKTSIPESFSGIKTKRNGLIGYNKYQAEAEGYAPTEEEAKILEEQGRDLDGAIIFDLQNITQGIESQANYWDFKNFEVTNGAKNAKAFHLGGSNCVVDNVKVHDTGDSGIAVSRVSSSQITIDEWPSNNVLKNCESWNNADASFNNADGYAIKLTVGYGNQLIGCVSHHNSDDGWDLFCKQSGGYIAPITLINCVTYKTGYNLLPNGKDSRYSDRGGKNGFKMGGDNMPIRHVIKDCIAFENGNSGITSNSNPYLTIRGYVGYNNLGANLNLYSDSNQARKEYSVKGAVSYRKPGTNIIGGKSDDTNNVVKAARDGIGGGDGILTDENGEILNEYVHFDYNYLAINANGVTSDGEKVTVTSDGVRSLNASGDIVDDSFFVSLESPVVNGRIPQDPATGEYQLNGFLELKPEIKEAMAAVPNYEDPEPSTEPTTGGDDVEETTEKRASIHGSSSPKRGQSNSGGSGSNDNETTTETDNETETDSNAEVDNNTENTTDNTEKKVDEVVKTVEVSADDLNGSEIIKVDGGDDSNVFEIKLPASDSRATISVPGTAVYLPKASEGTVVIKKAEVLSEKVQNALGKNAVKVDFGSVKAEENTWIELAFDGDTSEPHKIIAVSCDENGNTTIIKPGYYDVKTGTVMIPVTGSGIYGAIVSDVKFADMSDNWAKVYVETLAARNIIHGVTDTTYNPNANIIRGDFTKMLADVLDITSVNDSGFADVKSSDYYSNAISAAKENGLVKGISATEFGAKDNITREDVMTIVARTLDAAGVDMQAADLSRFNDASQVSDYAKDGVAGLVGLGIIEGNNGKVNPKDNLTRAEAAKILYEVWNLF